MDTVELKLNNNVISKHCAEILSMNRNIISIELDSTFTTNNVLNFFVENKSNIKSYSFKQNNFNKNEIKVIAQMIKLNLIEIIDLSENKLDDDLINVLCKDLTFDSLNYLYLESNLITDVGVLIVSKWLSKNKKKLLGINLSHNQIKNKGLNILKICDIKYFIGLEGNPIDYSGIDYLIEIISNKEYLPNVYMKKVKLSWEQKIIIKQKTQGKNIIEIDED